MVQQQGEFSLKMVLFVSEAQVLQNGAADRYCESVTRHICSERV